MVVSMTTIPQRKERLLENLPYVLNQSYPFKTLIIAIDNNLSQEDKNFYYNEVKKMDKRIRIVEGDPKWRSTNKFMPALKLYPNEALITIDDDVAYGVDCIKQLMDEHKKHPDCVICHEVNPITVDKENKKIGFINGFDIKLKQIGWGKCLSNCALFPAHCFDGTDFWDYDKFAYTTNTTHEELFAWLQYTLKGIRTIGLNYVFTFHWDIVTPWKEEEYRLANFNNNQDVLNGMMDHINELYPELYDVIMSRPVEFTVTQDNVYAFLTMASQIRALYGYNMVLNTDGLSKSWQNLIRNAYNEEQK